MSIACKGSCKGFFTKYWKESCFTLCCLFIQLLFSTQNEACIKYLQFLKVFSYIFCHFNLTLKSVLQFCRRVFVCFGIIAFTIDVYPAKECRGVFMFWSRKPCSVDCGGSFFWSNVCNFRVAKAGSCLQKVEGPSLGSCQLTYLFLFDCHLTVHVRATKGCWATSSCVVILLSLRIW